MTKAEFDKIFNDRLDALKSLRDSKHKEYADDGETFRNLKDGATKLGIDPMLYAFHLMTKQYNSLHDYVKEWDETMNCAQADLDLAWEKVQDINIYTLLIYGLWVERTQNAKPRLIAWDLASEQKAPSPPESELGYEDWRPMDEYPIHKSHPMTQEPFCHLSPAYMVTLELGGPTGTVLDGAYFDYRDSLWKVLINGELRILKGKILAWRNRPEPYSPEEVRK